MKKNITLTEEELIHAAGIGVRRQAENIIRGRMDAYGCVVDNGWQLHIEGALAEYAVAKALRKPWDGNLGNLGAADVGTYEVRSTAYATGSLILHPKDKDNHLFILVTGINGKYCLRGGILGKDGKSSKYWGSKSQQYRPAFFVPQTALVSIDDLL